MALERLLVSGGDSRTAVEAESGRNKYLVPLAADDGLVSFASSTASPLTSESLRVAGEAAAEEGEDWAGLVSELRRELQLGDEVAVVPCASGTDGQLAALEMCRVERLAVASCDQTGSGTQHTARGEAFDGADKGHKLLSLLRETRFVEHGKELDRREGEWLMAMQCSKLGLSSPLSLSGGLLIVDSCQMRVGRPRLAALLRAGCVVLCTLSKFFCAPAFCGLLLLPPRHVRDDWSPPPLSRGLFLRCRVGLDLMRRYYAVSLSRRLQLAQLFFDVVARELDASPSCRRLAQQREEEAEEEWPGDNEEFAVPSVVCFRVVCGERACDAAQLIGLYKRLAEEEGVLLGQPVQLPDGSAVLRISRDARWTVRLHCSDDPRALLAESLAFLRRV